jgi:hypothetical protein
MKKLKKYGVTKDYLLMLLKDKIGYKKTALKLSKEIGCSQSFLSEVLAGKKQMSEVIINYLGYETTIMQKD